VDLSAALQELRSDHKEGRLDATASHRAEVLIRDSVERYGDRMSHDVEREYSERLSAHQDALMSGSEGDKTITEIEYEGIRSERDGLSNLLNEYGYGAQTLRVENEDLRRVVEHERAGTLTAPVADTDQRATYREAVERDLDKSQTERLRGGDVDVLKDQLEDRLDRLYAAKHYLQSDTATANSEATRAVVEEIADHEYELNRADLIDGETERGETH
jgi:type IV secretion system T-DNA border endonuclease VirD2